jgi:hypothetical protein
VKLKTPKVPLPEKPKRTDDFDPSSIKIRKNVPRPGHREFERSRWLGLLDQMEPGDSFEFPESALKRVESAVRYYMDKRLNGRKFSFRKVAYERYGIWRIA